MKRITTIFLAAAALLMSACDQHEDVFFDTAFISIVDENGGSSNVIDQDANNLLTTLYITLSASKEKFTAPIEVSYEVIVGDGLKENVDFKIQSSAKSPVTLVPGIYRIPVRVQWYKNNDFNPDKDNTLTLKITGCTSEDVLIGYPGPDHIKDTYIFTKQ